MSREWHVMTVASQGDAREDKREKTEEYVTLHDYSPLHGGRQASGQSGILTYCHQASG